MAQVMVCDFCEQVPGLFMVGTIATGEQTVVCGYCAPQWAQTIIDALSGGDGPDPEPVADTGGDLVDMGDEPGEGVTEGDDESGASAGGDGGT